MKYSRRARSDAFVRAALTGLLANRETLSETPDTIAARAIAIGAAAQARLDALANVKRAASAVAGIQARAAGALTNYAPPEAFAYEASPSAGVARQTVFAYEASPSAGVARQTVVVNNGGAP